MTPTEPQNQRAGKLTRLTLPWPDKKLSSNSRTHWAKKARLIKSAKHDAWWAAMDVGLKRNPRARLEFYFHPPDARRRDMSNMPGHFGIKAYIDGIAGAMGCDDNGFRVSWPEKWGAPVKGGEVVVWVTIEKESE